MDGRPKRGDVANSQAAQATETVLAIRMPHTKRWKSSGPCIASAGMNRVARFMMDPRDKRSEAEWFDVVAGDQGVFGCLGMMACADVCPKELPLLEVYAYLRRRALGARFLAKGD